MEISGAIAGLVSVGAAHGLAFSKLLLHRNSTAFAIAAVGSLPTDSVSSPTVVRSGRCKTGPAPRALVRRSRRTRRRSRTVDGGEDGLSGDGDGDDGPFGGGGSGSSGRGGGRGWDYGGPDWEGPEQPSSPSSDPAFDFVYEVLSWLALSNCAHYAYKKIGRFLTDREKIVPVRLVQSIC